MTEVLLGGFSTSGLVFGNTFYQKKAVRVATTTNGTLATAYQPSSVVDGVSLVAGDRILIKNQTSAIENGIYDVQTSGAPIRAEDLLSGISATSLSVYVIEGTQNYNTQWICTSILSSSTTGTHNLIWEKTGGKNMISKSDAAISADNIVPRFDGATNYLQESTIVVGDTGNMSGLGTLAFKGATNDVTISATNQATNPATITIPDLGGTSGNMVITNATQTLSNKTLGSNLNTNNFYLTNVPTPVNSTDAVNKNYVDNIFPSSSFDAFRRFRISQPETLFDSAFLSLKNESLWAEQTTGDGSVSYVANNAYCQFQSASNGTVTRQTRRYIQYQPGKSQLIFITGTLNSNTNLTNMICQMGYFDANNGYFFQLSGSTFSVVERTNTSGSPVDITVNQASFNIDPSYVIDFTKRQLFFIEMAWLGVSAVTMGLVGLDKECVPLHRFNHANSTSALPYINRPSLPVRYSITNTSSSAMNMVQICSTVISEGGYRPLGNIYSYIMTSTISVTATETAFIGLRATSARNKVSIVPISLSAIVTSATAPMLWRIYRIYSPPTANTTILGNSTWSSTNNFESAAEVHTTASTFDTTGFNFQVIAAGHLDASSGNISTEISRKAFSGIDLSDNVDWFVLTAQRIGGGTETMAMSITWQEIE